MLHQSNLHIKNFPLENVWSNYFCEEKKRVGASPQRFWHILRWENDLVIHEMSPENPVKFKKRAVALGWGGGKTSP